MGEVDFVGQATAEKVYTYILLASGVLGTALGFVLQNFSYTFLCIAAGTLISLLLVVPAWPFYCLNPVKFLPVVPVEKDKPLSPSADSSRIKKKK